MNLRDYLTTQMEVFFDVSGYRSAILESLLKSFNARDINTQDFLAEFGLEDSFIIVFSFILDPNNFDRLVEYGNKCHTEKKTMCNQVVMV